MTQRQKRMILASGLSLTLVLLIPLVSFAAIVPCTGADDCDFNDLITMVNRIMDFLLTNIALPLSALLFAWAGILLLTAAGDTGKISKAKEIFKNVFFGLIFALASWLIIDLITTTLSGSGGWTENPFTHN